MKDMDFSEQMAAGLGTASANFQNIFYSIFQTRQQTEAAWVEQLLQQGVKAAHPDDGWVDRQRNRVKLINPYFNAGVTIGDTIAIGNPQQYRLATITRRIEGIISGESFAFAYQEKPCA